MCNYNTCYVDLTVQKCLLLAIGYRFNHDISYPGTPQNIHRNNFSQLRQSIYSSISVHTHTTLSLSSTMKKTLSKSSTASKSSASKKQSVLPVTQKVSPALPKQVPIPSSTATMFAAATSDKHTLKSKVVNCPSQNVVPSSQVVATPDTSVV